MEKTAKATRTAVATQTEAKTQVASALPLLAGAGLLLGLIALTAATEEPAEEAEEKDRDDRLLTVDLAFDHTDELFHGYNRHVKLTAANEAIVEGYKVENGKLHIRTAFITRSMIGNQAVVGVSLTTNRVYTPMKVGNDRILACGDEWTLIVDRQDMAGHLKSLAPDMGWDCADLFDKLFPHEDFINTQKPTQFVSLDTHNVFEVRKSTTLTNHYFLCKNSLGKGSISLLVLNGIPSYAIGHGSWQRFDKWSHETTTKEIQRFADISPEEAQQAAYIFWTEIYAYFKGSELPN